MNSLIIEQLLMGHLAQWQYFDKDRTARDNRNFTPPTDGVWYRISILGGVNHIAGMSDVPCVREVGMVVVQVFDRENNGTKSVKQMADSLAKHLGCTMLGKLELLAPSIVNVGVGGGFYQINVSVPYRYN